MPKKPKSQKPAAPLPTMEQAIENIRKVVFAYQTDHDTHVTLDVCIAMVMRNAQEANEMRATIIKLEREIKSLSKSKSKRKSK